MPRGRRLSVTAFLLLALAGAGGLVLAASGDRRGDRSLDVESTRVAVTLAPGRRVCQGPITPGLPFSSLRLWTGGRPVLSVAVRGADGRGMRLASGTARAHAAGPVTVRLSRPVAAGRSVQLCVRNRSRRAIALAGDQPSPVSGVLFVPGPQRALAAVLIDDRPPSLLSRIGTVFRRAALFKAGWVGEWTFWMLLGFAVAAVLLGAVSLGLHRRQLLPLLIAAALFGIAWALVVPPFQSPDELDHYAYVESLASRGALPGEHGRPGWSSNQRAAVFAVGAQRVAGRAPEVEPSWNPSFDAAYRRRAARLARSDGGGPLVASVNPPAYYGLASIPYLTAGASGNVLDRLYAIRICGVLLLIATILAGWLLAGEVLGAAPLPRLAAAAVVGLEPMETFLSTSVNPDALQVPLWTFALWLGSRVVRRGARTADLVALALVLAGAILTKASSYALVPAAVLAVVLGLRGRTVAASWRAALAGAAALALPVIAWLIFAGTQHRQVVNTVSGHTRPFRPGRFLEYLWQFYLPRLPGMKAVRVPVLPPPSFHYLRLPRLHAPARLLALPAWEVWLKEAWAAFGWTEVRLAGWAYGVLAAALAVIAAVALRALAAARSAPGTRALAAVFAAAVAVLLAGLHVTEFQSLVAGDGPVLQGRYLLPLIGILGLAAGGALQAIGSRPRVAAVAAGVGLAGLMLLQLLSLATVLRTYYS